METPCHPTEDREKVKRALLELFPDLAFEREDEVVAGTAGTLDRLRELIRNQKIRDAARGQLLSGRRGDVTRVRMSKQAAFVGRANFTSGGPLGDVVVEIESDVLDGVIDDLAESTSGGT